MVASKEGKMLQAAYETLGAFEEAIRSGARGDLSEEDRDDARTAMGNVLDEMAEALYRERERVEMLEYSVKLLYDRCRELEREQGVVAADAPGQPGEEGQGE
jgi:hypothetical protein